MHGPDWAWALLIAIMAGGLALATAGVVCVAWRIWRRKSAWWRWLALASLALLLLGAGVSLGQLAAELL